jgi:hypothetical protein
LQYGRKKVWREAGRFGKVFGRLWGSHLQLAIDFIKNLCLNKPIIHMKTIAYFLSLVFLVTSLAPAAVAKDLKEENSLTPEEELRLEEISERVAEIKAMDFAKMSKAEKRELRKELREINKETKALSGGVYLSVGAIIVILLILILIT